jgi:SAM-dependent methyltransferase
MSIFAYVEGPADPGWRLSPVGWDGSQLVADIGCGNGFELRQLVPEGRCRHAIGIDLSAGMLRTLDDLRGSGRLTILQGDAQQLPLADDSVDVAMAMHMLYHVPHMDAAVRELRRIVRPGGTVLASTNSTGSLSEIHGLLNNALSEHLGHTAEALPALTFTTETGAAALEHEFPEVTLHRNELSLAFPHAQPVRDYLDSLREPILAHVGEPVDFDAVLDEVCARVEAVVTADGCFQDAFRSGVFACR